MNDDETLRAACTRCGRVVRCYKRKSEILAPWRIRQHAPYDERTRRARGTTAVRCEGAHLPAEPN